MLFVQSLPHRGLLLSAIDVSLPFKGLITPTTWCPHAESNLADKVQSETEISNRSAPGYRHSTFPASPSQQVFLPQLPLLSLSWFRVQNLPVGSTHTLRVQEEKTKRKERKYLGTFSLKLLYNFCKDLSTEVAMHVCNHLIWSIHTSFLLSYTHLLFGSELRSQLRVRCIILGTLSTFTVFTLTTWGKWEPEW